MDNTHKLLTKEKEGESRFDFNVLENNKILN